jgi:hypothetical protein
MVHHHTSIEMTQHSQRQQLLGIGRYNCLLTQPAQSPDTNILDLSFFRALQSAQWDHGFATEIDGLMHK